MKSIRTFIIAFALAGAGFATLFYHVMADGGALDPSFSGSGMVTTGFGADATAYAVAIQPDGKIVVAGYFRPDPQAYNYKIALARYNPDGSLDPSFGNGGKVLAGADGGVAYSVAIQPDGKILTGGDRVVNRFNSDGSLDASFGSIGATAQLLYPYTMTVQPNGKILVGGYITVSYHNQDFAVGRYNSDGTVDTSFGNGGKVTTEFYGGHDQIHALAVQPDGKIIAAGQATWGGNDYFSVLARYDANGNLDTGFGNNGKVTTDFSPGQGMRYHRFYAVAVQPDGKILVAGATRHYNDRDSFAIARYNSDGSPDTTFGNGGQVTTKVLGYPSYGSSLALQANGKFFVAGLINTESVFSTASAFAVAHYNSNGSLDTSFGANNNGQVVTQIYGHKDNISAIALQSDGKLVAAGSAAKTDLGNGYYGDYDFALARYLSSSSCTYALSSTSLYLPANGGAGSLNITTGSGCNWTATTNDNWILITSAGGSGNGTLTFEVRENFTGNARSGSISIAGQTFAVIQNGGPGDNCEYSLSPTSSSFSASGGAGTIQVTASVGCAWQAVSNANWITITSNNTGIGNGVVSYSVGANPNASGRKGTISIAGQTFSVKQKGG